MEVYLAALKLEQKRKKLRDYILLKHNPKKLKEQKIIDRRRQLLREKYCYDMKHKKEQLSELQKIGEKKKLHNNHRDYDRYLKYFSQVSKISFSTVSKNF